MILQQKTAVRLWGSAEPGAKVTIIPSWSGKEYKTIADMNGDWMVKVKTPEASFVEHSIAFDDGDIVVVNNVLIGEVWLCGGQSNMEMPMEGWKGCPVEGYKEILADSSLCAKNVRYCSIPEILSVDPKDDTECKGVQTSISTFGKQSAISYYFAGMVSEKLNIPIGIIGAYRGGTRIEGWLDKEALSLYTDEPIDYAEICKKYPNPVSRPMVWGNGILHPVLNYTIKGILFYQGCANVGDGDHYADRLKILAEQWRRDFGDKNIPFYYVQIAPYYYGNATEVNGAELREQQFKAKDLIPNSAIVGTNDCVYSEEMKQIHPCQKKKIAERLASIALRKNYKFKDIKIDSPEFKSLKVVGDTAYVELDNINFELVGHSTFDGFEIAGDNQRFYSASAVPVGKKMVKVCSESVVRPIAVRYCYRNFLLGNVENEYGLPLFPFRTDRW